MATPSFRAECRQAPRPCPHTRCRYAVCVRNDTALCALDSVDRPSAGLLPIATLRRAAGWAKIEASAAIAAVQAALEEDS